MGLRPDGAEDDLVMSTCHGPFPRRGEALEAEAAWLEANWLTTPP